MRYKIISPFIIFVLMLLNIAIVYLSFVILCGLVFIYCDPSFYTESLEKEIVNIVGIDKHEKVKDCLHEYWEQAINAQNFSFWFVCALPIFLILLGGIGFMLSFFICLSHTSCDNFIYNNLLILKKQYYIVFLLILNFLNIVILGVLLIYSTCQINYNPFALFSNALEIAIVEQLGADKQEVIKNIFNDFWEDSANLEKFQFFFTSFISCCILFLAFIGFIIALCYPYLHLSKSFETHLKI